MPHQLLHDFEFDSEASKQRAVGVTKRVPSDPFLDAQPFGSGLYVVTHDCCSPTRLSPIAQSTGKHPIVTVFEFALLSPFDQCCGKLGMHRNRLLRGFCLAAPFDTTDNRSDDIQLFMFEIDVSLFQTEEFALSQPS
jgi:hypothetical protein